MWRLDARKWLHVPYGVSGIGECPLVSSSALAKCGAHARPGRVPCELRQPNLGHGVAIGPAIGPISSNGADQSNSRWHLDRATHHMLSLQDVPRGLFRLSGALHRASLHRSAPNRLCAVSATLIVLPRGTGGLGVASSNLASPTNSQRIERINPDRLSPVAFLALRQVAFLALR